MVLTRLLLAGTSAAAAYRYHRVTQIQKSLPQHQLTNLDSSKHVVVVGGGVVGVSTAYKLAQKGYSVVVLESQAAPGDECSACAAGGMQRSNPVVDRGTWVAVAKCMFPNLAGLVFGRDGKEPFNFFEISWLKTLSDPHFLRWALSFSYASLFPDSSAHERQQEMLKFTDYSIGEMVAALEADGGALGALCGYNTKGAMDVSLTDDVQPSSNTYEPEEIRPFSELARQEPGLNHMKERPIMTKFQYEAKSANSERFTKHLAERCVEDPNLDVHFVYNTNVKAVDVDSQGTRPRITALRTNRGVVKLGDDTQVVIAAGSWTPQIFAMCGLYAPVYPLKGYCIPFPASSVREDVAREDLPGRIVCDKYLFTTRLGDEIRITSIGEFAGWDTTPDPDVDGRFREAAVERMPHLKQAIAAHPTRCGLRPYVSDGLVLLGRVDLFGNLLVNCGPGSNGWKNALGAGEVIARQVADQPIDQDLGFQSSQISPQGRVKSAPLFSKLSLARWADMW